MEESIKSLVTSFNSEDENKNCPIIAFQFVSLDSKDKTKLKWWSYNCQDISKKYDNIVIEFIGEDKLERTLINCEYGRAPYWTKSLGGDGKIINKFNESYFKFKEEPDPLVEKKTDWYNHKNSIPDLEVLNYWGNLLEKHFGKGTAMWVSIPHKDANKRTIYSSVFCLFNDKASQEGLLDAYFLIRDFITNYLIDLYKAPVEKQRSLATRAFGSLAEKVDDKIVISGNSKLMNHVITRLKQYSKLSQPILLLGPEGTGKSYFAEEIIAIATALINITY